MSVVEYKIIFLKSSDIFSTVVMINVAFVFFCFVVKRTHVLRRRPAIVKMT